MPTLDCISILEPGSFSTDSGTVIVPSGDRPFPFPIVIDVELLEAASANDTLNAVVGMVLYEAANATDTVTTAAVYTMEMFEPAAAFDDFVVRDPEAFEVDVSEAAAATDTPDAATDAAGTMRSAMLPGVFVNSDGTARQANVNGIMVNL